jgi:mediator of RNA polymerase II transcription subunit 17
LDLVAQLLSRDPTKNLEASFSEQYKQQRVPKGSFGLAKGAPPDRSDEREEQLRIEDTAQRKQLLAKGSRMEALEWATDSFLKAATELETEVHKETTYWNEIISISQRGWSIQRLGRDSRHSPFAVRYGFPEASDHFKARGLAPLHMDKDGGIILDPALALKPKTLRVRIINNGKIVGTSCLPAQGQTTGVAVEKSIQLARDSLFEEELYHEISLEARQLLAYGAELRDSIISLPAPGLTHDSAGRKVLIDCIARDDDVLDSQDLSENWFAQNVAEALRLLLTHEHRMRLFRRSQLPSPLTQQKRSRENPPLLRTLLAVLNHLNAVDSLQAYLIRVESTLTSAGFSVSLQTIRETSWVTLTQLIADLTKKDLSAVDQLLEVFSKPFDGLATLSLPSSELESEKVTIATRTYFGVPTFGTEHKVTLPPSLVSVLNLSQDQKREFKFPSADEVISYLDWILSLDMSHSLLTKEYARRAIIMSKDPRVFVLYKAGKETKQKEVAVQFEGGKLTLTVGNNISPDEVYAERTYTWDGTRAERSFKESLISWVG